MAEVREVRVEIRADAPAQGRECGNPSIDFEEQVSEALDAVRTGVEDARRLPGRQRDDLHWEIANAIAAQYGPEVSAEVKRRLGF